jgi:bifunctional non-homologous end joining protein LigD
MITVTSKDLMKPKGGLPKSLSGWISERKFDGHSGLLSFNAEGRMTAFSGKKEVTSFLPDIKIVELHDTVVHVEFTAGYPSRAHRVSTMLSAKTYRAVNAPGIAPFDILFVHGEDVRSKMLIDRHEILDDVIVILQKRIAALVVYSCTRRHYDIMFFYDEIVEAGGEGIVLKKADSPYVAGKSRFWRKHKVIRSTDAVAFSYSPGGGKYEGMLGSLKLGLYRDGELVSIARASGMTDSQRRSLKERLDNGEKFVCEVAYQNWTSGGRLRHPRFLRLREDKEIASCTWEDQGPRF